MIKNRRKIRQQEAAERANTYSNLSTEEKLKRAKAINPNSAQVQRLTALLTKPKKKRKSKRQATPNLKTA